MVSSNIEESLQKHITSKEGRDEFRQVLKFFKNSSNGYFIEVGANDPITNSQTYLLEELGWTGVLVEPLKACYEQCVAKRPKSKVFNVACTSPEKIGEQTIYFSHENDVMASLEKNVDDSYLEYGKEAKIEAVTLNSILENTGIEKIDFLSIDTEGTELDVLRGFDIKKYKPRLILLEDKLNTLGKHKFLLNGGYKLVRRIGVNNWYVPKETEFEKISLRERIRFWRKTNPAWAFLWKHYKKWYTLKKAQKVKL